MNFPIFVFISLLFFSSLRGTFEPPPLQQTLLGDCGVIAHIHQGKTAGSTFNLATACMYQHVCGNKGNSWQAEVGCSSRTKYFSKNTSAGVVEAHKFTSNYQSVFCELISDEIDMGEWEKVRTKINTKAVGESASSCPLIALVPCREPFDHILSYCNQRGVDPSRAKTVEELLSMCWKHRRFDFEHISTGSQKIFDQEYCFDFHEWRRTVKNLGLVLTPQRRNHSVNLNTLIFETNLPRSSKAELSVEHLRDKFNKYARKKIDYFGYCDDCIDFNDYIEKLYHKSLKNKQYF